MHKVNTWITTHTNDPVVLSEVFFSVCNQMFQIVYILDLPQYNKIFYCMILCSLHKRAVEKGHVRGSKGETSTSPNIISRIEHVQAKLYNHMQIVTS